MYLSPIYFFRLSPVPFPLELLRLNLYSNYPLSPYPSLWRDWEWRKYSMRQKVWVLRTTVSPPRGMFRLTEIVAKHNTPESCWVVLYGKVYDVRFYAIRSSLCITHSLAMSDSNLGHRFPGQPPWRCKDHSETRGPGCHRGIWSYSPARYFGGGA